MWSNKYIGIPFKEKGRDYSGLDCWGLVRLVYKEQFGIDLPSFSEDYSTTDDTGRLEDLIAQYKEGWAPVDKPSEGTVVLFRILGSETHIGVAINENEFLHISENSYSALEKLDSTSWKNRVVGYFRYSPNKLAVLNAVPHPLKTERYTVPILPGTKLDDLADWVVKEWKIQPELKAKITILVNGIVIPYEEWPNLTLKESDTVEYRAVPGKDALKLVLVLVVAYYAPILAGQLTGYTAAATAAAAAGTTVATSLAVLNAAVTVGLSLVGTALVNAVFPVRPPAEPTNPGSSERQMMLTGGANQANPYGTIPIVLGKVRVTPPIGATNYITFANERDSYLSMMLVWGYGPVVLDQSTLRIGDVAYTDFEFAKFDNGSNMLVTLDRQNDDPTTTARFNAIYGNDIFQRNTNIELVCDGSPENSSRSTSGNSSYVDWRDATTVDIGFSGAVSGQKFEVTISRTDGGQPLAWGDWSSNTARDLTSIVATAIDSITTRVTATVTGPNPQISLIKYSFISVVYQGFLAGSITPGIWQEASTTGKCSSVTVALHFPQGLRKIKAKGDDAGESYAAPVGIEIQTKVGTGPWLPWISPVVGADGYKKDAFTVTYTKSFETEITSGVQVRVRRTTGDNTEDNPDWRYYHTAVFLAATFINNDKPAVDPKNCKIAKTALRLKANEQFNGQIQGVNAVVQTYCMAFNGSNWAMRATNNPADLFRYILQHPANPQRVLDSEVSEKINLTQLQYWWNYCNQNRTYTDPVTNTTTTYKLTYNSVVAGARSVLEILRDICAAGRASPAMVDGKWTVIIDEPRSTVVQHFTPHNSWGFEGLRALPKLPDGLKVTYYDEDQDYQQVETIVYRAGKDQTTAELFESITLPGVTKREIVIDHAKWHMAQAQLRRESYTINTDVEYLVCNRGDRVKVTHDVPMWGLGSGRVKSIPIAQRTLELDEPVGIETDKSYTIRIRTNTGASIEKTVLLAFTLSRVSRTNNEVTFTLTTPSPFVVGDIVSIGCNTHPELSGNHTITQASPTSFSYVLTGASIPALTIAGGFASYTNGYYNRVTVATTSGMSQVNPGDLFLFGLYEKESQDLVVLNIEPSNNKSARLTLVDYGVTDTYNIFNDYKNLSSATVFNTNITLAPVLNRQTYKEDQKPQVTTLTSDEAAAELTSDRSYALNLRVSYANTITDLPVTTTSVECQYDLSTATTSANYKSTIVPYLAGSISIPNVIKGESYKVRLRYLSGDGGTGPWTQWYSTTIQGKLIPPSTPINFTHALKETGIEFKWEPSNDVAYATSVIKYTTQQIPANLSNAQKEALWASGTEIFEGNASTWLWTTPGTGKYYVMIKHKDTSGNFSLTINSTVVDFTQLVLASLQVEFTNPIPVIAYVPNTNTPILTNSGTQVALLQGGTRLKYDGVGTTNGTWKIVSKTDSTGITSGAFNATPVITGGDDYATVANVAAYTASENASVTYVISGKTTLGNSFTLTKVLTYYSVRPSSSSSIVFAYKRGASAPTDNPGAVTYSFVTAGITSPAALANNWSKSIIDGTEPLWVVSAAASSNTGTDDIAANEWSAPVKYAANGLNTAIVRLFARNSSTTTAPSVAAGGNTTYTFSTGAASGIPNGWSQTVPAESQGNVIWTIQATAVNTADTDSIPNTEWSAPVEFGRQGDPGISSALVYAYLRTAQNPNDYFAEGVPGTIDYRPGQVVYSFSTNQIITEEVNMNGWKKEPYAGTDPLWVRVATAASNIATDTIANTEWSNAIKYVENGLSTATVFLYARNNSTSTPPALNRGTLQNTWTSTYTFTTGGLTNPPTGWTTTIPDVSNGTTIWVIQATVIGTGTTDVIYGSEWSVPKILTLRGAQGNQGPRSAFGYVYFGVSQATAPAKPSATDYDFDAGSFTGLTANWSTSINVDAVKENNTNQKYWAAKFTVTEASFGGEKTISFSNPSVHLNLDGIVTFTNLANKTDKSGTVSNTIIDGGAIKTGSIDADRLSTNIAIIGQKLKSNDDKFVLDFVAKTITITV